MAILGTDFSILLSGFFLSVPQDHRLSSLGKPRDAKWRSWARIFLSYPQDFFYPSLRITVCHHSASLVMLNGDPGHGFFYPTLRIFFIRPSGSPFVITRQASWCQTAILGTDFFYPILRIFLSVPRDHRLSSLGKPRDAKRRSLGWIFLSYPHTHDIFLPSSVS